MAKYFPCPSCGRPTEHRHQEAFAHHRHRWYVCACRYSFRTLTDGYGENEEIVARTPYVDAQPGRPALAAETDQEERKVFFMGCPTCGKYGKIKTGERRRDVGEHWRRHQCETCGPYYTCEYEDGSGTVHRKLKSRKPVEV